MNKFFSMVSLGALAAAALPAQAAVARTYPDALSRAGHKPIVLFCYGANTDKYNQDCYDTYIKKRAISDAVRTCMFVEVPMYQFPDARQKKEMDSIIGKGLPSGIYTMPCLAVVDSRGNLRGIVQRSDEMKDPETAKAALKKILDAFDTQEDLIVKAEKAGGARKSKIYMEAANVKGVTMPPLANVDLGKSKGKAGQVKAELEARNKFDPLALVEKLQTMELGAAENYVMGMVNQEGYSLEQRQMMLAALGGHVRRNKGSVEKMREIYTKMRDLDPEAPYGAYAQGALDLWVDKKDAVVTKMNDIPAEITRTNNVVSTAGSGRATPGANDMPTIPSPSAGGTKTAMGSTALGTPATPAQPDTESMEDE